MRYFYSDGIEGDELIKWGPGILKNLPNTYIKSIDLGSLGDRFYLRCKATEVEAVLDICHVGPIPKHSGGVGKYFYGRKRRAPSVVCVEGLSPWTKLSELLPVLEVLDS